MDSFKFENLCFIGPASGSERSEKSRVLVNCILNSGAKVSWKPYDFLSLPQNNLQKKLKKIKNALLNYSQIIVDSDIDKWDNYLCSIQNHKNKTLISVLNKKKISESDILLINGSRVEYIIVESENLIDYLQKNNCNKKLLLRPVVDLEESDNITENIILYSGWYPLEYHNSLYLRWSSQESVIQINQKYYDSIEIDTVCDFEDRDIFILVKEKESDEYKEVLKKEYKLGSKINICIDLKNYKYIKIKTSGCAPSQADGRLLGIKLYDICVTKNGKKILKSISALKDKNLLLFDDIVPENDIIYNSYSFFNRKELEFDALAIDDVTVVLTCHGDRLSFGKKAYKSIIEAGFSNIVIAVSGNDKDYEDWARSLKHLHDVVIIKNDINNNDCWRQGVAMSKTFWSMILHDDDLFTASIKKELSYLSKDVGFACLNGHVKDFDTGEILFLNTVNFPFQRGVYSSRLIENLLFQYPLTISPIHGVFKTNELLEALQSWEDNHGKDKSFYFKDTFVVGNDLYIWLHIIKKNELFYASPKTCVECIGHSESATHVDWSSDKKFIDVYSSVKNIYISKPLKSGMILYLHDLSEQRIKCLENLKEYKKSDQDLECIVFSTEDLDIPFEYGVNFIKIEDDDFSKALVNPRWSFGAAASFWAFVKSIEIAETFNLDFFLCYEWDCKVGQDYWYDTLWQQCLSWQEEPYLMGTPVFNFPGSHSGNMLQGSLEYRYKYSKECRLNMLTQTVDPFCLYTNGALTFYNTKIAKKYYSKELSLPSKNRCITKQNPNPWDIDIGYRIFKDIKEESFNKIGWLPSSYSGCTDIFYNKKQREKMLSSKMKAAVHQFKY